MILAKWTLIIHSLISGQIITIEFPYLPQCSDAAYAIDGSTEFLEAYCIETPELREINLGPQPQKELLQ